MMCASPARVASRGRSTLRRPAVEGTGVGKGDAGLPDDALLWQPAQGDGGARRPVGANPANLVQSTALTDHHDALGVLSVSTRAAWLPTVDATGRRGDKR